VPQTIRCDNGPKLTSRHFLARCVKRHIELLHIQPGKPIQNGRVESFHGRLREEWFEVGWFQNLFERFQVIRHVGPKLSCLACDRIAQAPARMRPIERGLAGPRLLAHVLFSKYPDHLPLYRQSEICAREGVDLQRSTLVRGRRGRVSRVRVASTFTGNT
jgi:transposase InsO family protein